MERVLLLRPDRAGDALKTLPVVRALVSAFPRKQFYILLSQHNSSLFEFEPGVTSLVLPSNWNHLPKEEWLSSMGLGSVFPYFDKVINLLCDPFPETDILLNAIPAREKYSLPLHNPNSVLSDFLTKLELPQHTPAGKSETLNIAFLLSQVFYIPLASMVEKMNGSPIFSDLDRMEAKEKMGKKRGKWIGLCPLSSLPSRTIPLKRWTRFINSLTQDPNLFLFLFGGPSDFPRLEEMIQKSKHRERIEILFPSQFRTLGAYFERLDGVVAVDSGPLHLARAMKIPSLGVLSGSDVKRWFPGESPKDVLVRRGWFQKFPTSFQILTHFMTWQKKVFG